MLKETTDPVRDYLKHHFRVTERHLTTEGLIVTVGFGYGDTVPHRQL